MADAENGQGPQVEDEQVEEAQASSEPVDIAEAFKLLREQEHSGSETGMEGGEAEQRQEPEPTSEAGREPQDSGATGDDAPVGYDEQPEEYDDAGRYPAQYQTVDYNAQLNRISQQVQNQAGLNVAKKFQDAKINKLSIGDLYQRDEETGDITFTNPDNPHRPFESRYEAQQWLDSFNGQIDAEFRKQVRQEQQRLTRAEKPRYELLRFAPVYDAMDDGTREIFDAMIEPYEVHDSQGDPVGYNCNLMNIANQAVKISKRFGVDKQSRAKRQTEQQQQSRQDADEPAMDMRTGANAEPEFHEPKNLEDAMKMYNEARKKQRSK